MMQKLIKFLISGISLYLILCFLLPQSIISKNTTGGDTYLRLNEVQKFKDVDILFLGSSHSYRSFDPREFYRYGYRVFNLGSSAQSPILSYYLLKEYWPILRPKLVVLEVYYEPLINRGVEGFLKIAVNHALDKNIILMALESRSIYAINTITSEFLKRLKAPLHWERPDLFNRYVSGGFWISYGEWDGKNVKTGGASFKKIEPMQLLYLKRIIQFSKQRHSRIVLVVQPMPSSTLKNVSNYPEISNGFSKIALENQIDYFDFNDIIKMREPDDFKDRDHLNQRGVIKFDQIFISKLREKHILPH